jgi:periplasmic copper chaperone A
MRAWTMMAVAASVALTGCSKPDELTVSGAVVRLSANPKATSAGYFTIKGGPADDRLLSVSSPVVIRIEMHESAMQGGMMTMKPLTGGVAVPARTDVKFEQGGKHIMLFDINPGMTAGKTIQLTFVFASGLQLLAYAPLRAPGSIN